MNIRTGCDLVKISRITALDEESRSKIFHPSERTDKIESLAGVFAVKESCKKIFNDLSWLDIEVVKDPSGKPRVLLVGKEFLSGDVSISHDGEYAIAVVISME